MRPSFDAALVNPPFGDPGILIDLKFLRRALLFDVGDVSGLPPRKLLRVSDLFVSHTHMDHFAGFDRLLRVGIGRSPGLAVYGPAGFIGQVGHKLAAYTWNLVENYPVDFVVTAHELTDAGVLRRARFRSGGRFVHEPMEDIVVKDGVLLESPWFRVCATPLDHHGIASLAFAFEEGTHINVWKNRLEELGLPTGGWLTELKARVRENAPDDTPIRVHWRTREGGHDRVFPLAELKARVLEFVPGQRVCYVTDAADHPHNRASLARFLKDADLVFIEAVFLDEDREQAARKAHLTARAAGEIARGAGVKLAVPFHFSTRYLGRQEELRRDFERGWHGDAAPVA
jgi:ribonuclease Z